MIRSLRASLLVSALLASPAVAQAAPKQSVAIYDATAAEEAGALPVKVCKVGPNRKTTIDVHLNVLGVSGDTAKAGTDFVPIEDLHLPFAPLDLCKTVDLQLIDDAIPEVTEYVTATITAGNGARLYDGKAKLSITDSDATAPPPVPTCPDGSAWNAATGHCEALPPPPPPPPSGVVANLTANMGDSLSVCWSGSYSGIYKATHPEIDFRCLAVAGTGLSRIEADLPTVLALRPEKLSIWIGANDLPDQAWHDRLMVVVGKARAIGTRVYVGTLLPQNPGVSYTAAFNAAQPVENARLRADAAAKGYTVIDFAADFATWSAVYFGDYVHLNDAGQQIAAVRYANTLDGTAPAPPPVTGWEPSPNGLTGETPINGNFDINTALVSVPIPPSAAPDVKGAFRFICNAGQLLYDDPIVYPGQPGKSHLHQFYGNLEADAYSTYRSLRTKSAKSSCEGDTPEALNKSGYWMPAMLDGIGNVVRPDFVSIYYKRRPKTDPACNGVPGTPLAGGGAVQGTCVDLPNGLKFIFGFDMLTGKAPTGSLWFNCQGPGSIPGKSANLAEEAAKCPAGAQLGAVIEAPDCWDGKNLDSPNHRDHVAYGFYGNYGFQCPSTHPYVIPSFTLGAWFTSDANIGTWRLSSDAMRPDLPRGSTFHADFWMAWEPSVHLMWEGGCIAKLLNCSAGDLGNGKRIRNMEIRSPTYSRLIPVSALP